MMNWDEPQWATTNTNRLVSAGLKTLKIKELTDKLSNLSGNVLRKWNKSINYIKEVFASMETGL